MKRFIIAVLGIVVLFGLAFAPSAVAPKKEKPPKSDALTVILSGDLETVASCINQDTEGVVDLVKGPRGTLESTGPVAVLLKFDSTHGRFHPDESSTWDTPGCKVAEVLRLRFDGKILLALVLENMDLTALKVEKAGHREAFNLWAGVEGGDHFLGSLIEPVEGKLVSELHHFDRHNGKAPESHRDTKAFEGDLEITTDLR